MLSPIEKVYQSAIKLLTPLSLQETYETIVNEAIKLLGGSHGSLILSNSGRLKRVYASNKEMYKTKIRKRGNTYKAYRKRTIVTLNKSEVEKIHPEVDKISFKADIISPLMYKDRSIGALSILTNKKNGFNKKDQSTLKLFGPVASLAIRKAQLYNEA